MTTPNNRETYLAGWITAIIVLIRQGRLSVDDGMEHIQRMLVDAEYDGERHMLQEALKILGS